MLPQMPATIEFKIYKGSQLLQVISLDRENIQIGSLAAANLRIDDPSVGRVHAVIENATPGSVWISDLGTGGGTRVNGSAVERAQLSPGDQIQLGNIHIVVQWSRTSSADSYDAREYAKAAEVYGLFEETIVVNQQLSNPQGNRLRSSTMALLATGGLALFVALGSFIFLFQKIDAWKKQVDTLQAAKVPRSTWPAAPEYQSLQIGATVGALAGLALLFVGALHIARSRREAEFTIGRDSGALLNTSEPLPSALFPVVRAAGEHYEVLFTPDMTGELWYQGRKVDLRSLVTSGQAVPSQTYRGAYVLPLYKGSQVRLRLGPNRFFIYGVANTPPLPLAFAIQWELWAAMVVALGTFLALVWLTPDTKEDQKADPYVTTWQRQVELLENPPPEPEEKKKAAEGGGGKPGERASGEEGKMGKPDAKKQEKQTQIKGNDKEVKISNQADRNPETDKEQARQAAQNAGVLGVVQAMLPKNTVLGNIMSQSSALGQDSKDILSDLKGTPAEEDGYGQGGLGLVGSGRGGGGTGDSTIGLDRAGMFGKGGLGGGSGGGRGGGSGGGYGAGAGKLTGRKAGAPDVTPGNAEVRGSLDKELIRRIIRRHINEVKFCYERELVRNSDMHGRVSTQFTISPTGAVAVAMVTSLEGVTPAVGQCIVEAVRRWEFPKPQGGVVVVTYPFVLKMTGQ